MRISMYVRDNVKLLIACIYFGFSFVFQSIRVLAQKKGASKLVILYYHGVGRDERESFARQLDQLEACAKVVRADFSSFGSGVGLLNAITFDDAFSNLLENAVPELNRRSIPATIFVPVGLIGRVPTWDMSAESRLEADCVMTESELSSLSSKGITLGSHTVNHPRLSTLDDSQAMGELLESKVKLEDMFSSEISGIAFPYGDYNQRTLEICKEAGYRFAFSIKPEVIDPSKENFLRGRISVNPTDSPLVFYLKIHGAYSWMTHASRLKRFLASKLRSKQN